MFSGAVVIGSIPEVDATTERERAWLALLAELKSVWKRRTGVEAREVELLVEAEETQLYRWLGYPAIYAFIEPEIGSTPSWASAPKTCSRWCAANRRAHCRPTRWTPHECRSCQFLEVHHLVAREHGGTNMIGNLMCTAHHAQLHDGIITVRGTAPDLAFVVPLSPSWALSCSAITPARRGGTPRHPT